MKVCKKRTAALRPLFLNDTVCPAKTYVCNQTMSISAGKRLSVNSSKLNQSCNFDKAPGKDDATVIKRRLVLSPNQRAMMSESPSVWDQLVEFCTIL